MYAVFQIYPRHTKFSRRKTNNKINYHHLRSKKSRNVYMKLRANEKITTSTLCLTVKVGIHRVMGS